MTPTRVANVFRAVAQAAELCAARPADPAPRMVFRQVLRRLETELQADQPAWVA